MTDPLFGKVFHAACGRDVSFAEFRRLHDAWWDEWEWQQGNLANARGEVYEPSPETKRRRAELIRKARIA